MDKRITKITIKNPAYIDSVIDEISSEIKMNKDKLISTLIEQAAAEFISDQKALIKRVKKPSNIAQIMRKKENADKRSRK
jgi:hypothetical protein